jgi:glycolate oxidase iron-sulfur subunit
LTVNADTVVRGFSGDDVPDASVYDACIRCGLCLQSCPTYLETSVETSGPRGRISLVRAVGEGQLDLLSPGFVEQMSQCLDCRACAAVCPSGVQYGRLIEPARAQIRRAQAEREGAMTCVARYVTLHVLFKRLGVMRLAAWFARIAQLTGLQSLAALFGMRDLVALAPRLSGRPFVARGQRYETAGAQGVAFLHTGCIMHVAFPEVHEATVRMLRRAGLTVIVPADQGCCGAIAVHAGEADLGREMARRNIAAFETSGADVYVVNAAGCGSALKEYAELFGVSDPWHTRAERFSSRVRDVLEVLDAVDLPAPSVPLSAAVTYQEPCHLAHAQRVTAAPRRLLAKIPGLQFVEMPESSVCCGSAGIYNLTQRSMAQRLGRRKATAIARTGATVVATANPGCAMQVASSLRSAGYTATVRHVVELLDAAYPRDRFVD